MRARHGLLALLLSTSSAAARMDAGHDDTPRGPEQRALETQVALLRAEVAKPRDWYQRERADKLKSELAQQEKSLSEVHELYAARLAQCRALWRANPTGTFTGIHPAYFTCPERAVVTDETVRWIKRRHEVERRLTDRGLPVDTRTALQREARELAGRIDKESGNEPLYLESSLWTPDAGPVSETR